MRRIAACTLACAAVVLIATSCASRAPRHVSAVPPAAPTRATAESISARDQRIARLELRLLEEEAQVGDLQARLDDARQEVVRAMAKLQTLASKAEAASGMAEADIALQALRTAAGQGGTPEIAQAEQLLRLCTAEFDRQNYGGALYLANLAKGLAGSGQARLTSGGRATLRAGEVAFALPLRLQTLGRGNVREGPGSGYKVLFTLDGGTAVVGLSYADVWVRVSDESGRSGWIFSTLVGRRQADSR